MPWFKVDDQFATHPKVVSVPLAATGLWVRAGSWSSQHLTDGYVPRSALPLLGARASHAVALVKAGLWVEELDGWRFHDWPDYQPSAEETRRARDRAAADGRRGNHRRWHTDRGVRDPDCEFCQEDPRASPTRSGLHRVRGNRPVPVPDKYF
jgi:hypothetical protein